MEVIMYESNQAASRNINDVPRSANTAVDAVAKTWQADGKVPDGILLSGKTSSAMNHYDKLRVVKEHCSSKSMISQPNRLSDLLMKFRVSIEHLKKEQAERQQLTSRRRAS